MKTILLIEDDPQAIQILQAELRADGFKVVQVSDGAAGLNIIPEANPDLVLLDMQAPGPGAVEIIRKIRSGAATKNLPIIGVSNEFERKLVDAAWEAKITACLSRSSCTPRAILSTIQRILSTDKTGRLSTRPSLAATAQPVPEVSYHEQMRRNFLSALPKDIATLRSLLQDAVKSEDADRVGPISELHRHVRWLSANAGLVELPNIACLASALEALLAALCQRPKQINVSTLRTTAAAIDVLATLKDLPELAAANGSSKPSILAVDDEPVARRAVAQALERAHLNCESLECPETALGLLKEKPFDLIILDINMPKMSGLDLCRALRALPHHASTPVVFVTNLSDFQHRAKSLLAGGNDMIAKPFLLMELAVKARVSVQQSEIVKRKSAPAR